MDITQNKAYSNRKIWEISYPIFLSLLAQNVINVTDTAFLGRVGEVELGASAMGALYYICIFTIAFGFSTGSQIMMARRNGEKEYGQVGPVMLQGVYFLLFLSLDFFLFSRAFAGSIMSVLISSDAILDATMEFLGWRIFGFFFIAVNVMFRALFIGITRTKILTLSSVVMAVTNIILDYLLIFGKAGFPEMGIQGAAIASVVAEAATTLFFIIYTFCTIDIKKYGLNRFRTFDFKLLKRVLDISVFTMLQYFLAMATWVIFFVAIERLGQRELAIANIARSVYIVLFIPVNSLSATTNTLVSNIIGAGYTNQVTRLIRKIALLSLTLMAVFVAVTCSIPQLILSVYTNDSALITDAVPSLYVISAAMLVSSVANIAFNGVTGTGNTRPAFWIEMVTLVFYGSYIYYIGVYLRQPVEVCFTTELVYFSGLLLLSVLYLRFGKWQNKKI
ncbi:MAG: MATE family efflux transporter [Tannerellaceae bacterium]|nr:MATE family efflux transporter [Tannerellaceae bacterium]MCD8263961.1 MATE family efflux transporter [Tannerellaceae bacterium]